MERYECSGMIWPADYRGQLLGAQEISMLPIGFALKTRTARSARKWVKRSLLVPLAYDLSLVFEAIESCERTEGTRCSDSLVSIESEHRVPSVRSQDSISSKTRE